MNLKKSVYKAMIVPELIINLDILVVFDLLQCQWVI